MLVASYFNRFILFSFLGWIYECTYCTVKEGHWDNRGFLFGPICPIYGLGATAAMLAFYYIPVLSGGDTPWWKVFLICAIGSAILEYLTSYILEKKFHAMWWDYSHIPLNLNGRICLPASFAFGVAGIVIIKFFFPWLEPYLQTVDAHPLLGEALALLSMMALGMDLALTVASLTEFLAVLDDMQGKFDEKMEASVGRVANASGAIKEKVLTVARLTRRQRRHLHSIVTFKNVGHAKIADHLRIEDKKKKGLHWKRTNGDMP